MTNQSLSADPSEETLSDSAALHDRETLFRALAEISVDAVTIVDGEGNYRYISPAHEQLFGYASAGLLGQSAFDYIHPDDLAHVLGRFAQQLQQVDQDVPTEYRYRCKDGTWRSVETKGKLLPTATLSALSATSRSASGRNRRCARAKNTSAG